MAGVSGAMKRMGAPGIERGPPEVLLRVEGTVQGVGFRPFVYRLAHLLRVRGWVLNDAHGVLVRASGPAGTLEGFQVAIVSEAPAAARVERVISLNPVDYPFLPEVSENFVILGSQSANGADAGIPGDLAVCPDCLREMRDPKDRRFRYPFINCTNCGPRYSIIEEIPYDRPNTTMRGFELCAACRAEYEDPGDRRFHAEPIACPVCGPRLAYWNADGETEACDRKALQKATADIRAARIVAVKGIGGFHLVCNAANNEAVSSLRRSKRREEKPFAIMVGSLEGARKLCVLTAEEEKLLVSAKAPIVLAEKNPWITEGVCEAVAPENALLGVMLPYAPLYHLMFDGWNGVLVATSGNLSDEPICIDEMEAVARLRGIAESFLVHNRPIARPVDDSIVRFMMGAPVVLRRARGYAPTPVVINEELGNVLAVGAHLKNTVSVSVGKRIFPSQHLGDLATKAACDAFDNAIHTLAQLYPTHPRAVVCDLHPDYHSTAWARRQGLPVVQVQHHHAHVLACMAEYRLREPVLGVSWDGTGYGPDETVWGGEWLVTAGGGTDFERFAHLRTFRLTGGEGSIKRPALTLLGLLWEIFGEEAIPIVERIPGIDLKKNETCVIARMLSENLNTPVTSSAGRLFDAVAAMLGLGGRVAYEAQAAMKLEFAAMKSDDAGCYDFRLRDGGNALQTSPIRKRMGGPLSRGVETCGGHRADDPSRDVPVVVDWEPAIRNILVDLNAGAETVDIARRFHNTLAEAICAVARERPELPVVLTGGCFQNKLLTESAVRLLQENGIDVYWHREIPPNDGGVSVGQAAAGGGLKS